MTLGGRCLKGNFALLTTVSKDHPVLCVFDLMFTDGTASSNDQLLIKARSTDFLRCVQ